MDWPSAPLLTYSPAVAKQFWIARLPFTKRIPRKTKKRLKRSGRVLRKDEQGFYLDMRILPGVVVHYV